LILDRQESDRDDRKRSRGHADAQSDRIHGQGFGVVGRLVHPERDHAVAGIRDINAHLGLPVVVTGRIMQGASNISFGLSYLIMRERLTPAVFGVCCGVIAAVNGGVAGTDALLAGYLVDHFGYRSILC
jgi:MFS family permease